MVSKAGGDGNGGVAGAGLAGASVCREDRRGVRRGNLFDRAVFGCGSSGSTGGMADGIMAGDGGVLICRYSGQDVEACDRNNLEHQATARDPAADRQASRSAKEDTGTDGSRANAYLYL